MMCIFLFGQISGYHSCIDRLAHLRFVALVEELSSDKHVVAVGLPVEGRCCNAVAPECIGSRQQPLGVGEGGRTHWVDTTVD